MMRGCGEDESAEVGRREMNQGREGTDLGQQLIDDRVSHTGSSACRSTLLADGVQLIEDDDVKTRLVSLGLVLLRGESEARIRSA